MTDSTLHLMFNMSAAGSLRTALKHAGRNDEVIGLADCLSFGPIDDPGPQARAHWIETELNSTGWEDLFEECETFWNKAISDQRHKVLWTSRRSAMDYAGFLECLWRFGNAPCSVVDLTDCMYVGRNGEGQPTKSHLMVSPGVLTHYNYLEDGFLDQAKPLTEEKRAQHQDVWKHLRAENAAFRIVNGNELISAPITCFDDLVRSCAINEWRKSARVIGEALAKEMENELYQAGDLVLFARLQRLVELGILESRGDMSEIQKSEVRLPASA